jgi:EpsI family protein
VVDNFDQAVYDELNADKHIYRHYTKHGDIQIDLYIGYYGTAKGGRTPHNPYACFPGAGWAVLESREIAVDFGKPTVKLNYMLSKKESYYSVVFHWYQSAGNKVFAGGFEQNLQRFIGLIRDNRNDGAFVRISAVVKESYIDDAFSRTNQFAVEILRLIPSYWPVEK